jgi:hypothetical protein
VGGGAAALLLLGLGVHLARPTGYSGGMELMPLDRSLLPISAPVAALYLFLGLGALARHPALFSADSYRQALDRRRLVLWCLLMAAAGSLVAALSGEAAPPQTFLGYLRFLPVLAATLPGLALLSHVVYLGLLPIVLLLHWRRACGAAHTLGVGFTLFVAALLVQGLTTESRGLSHGVAALTLLAVLAVEDVRWPRVAPWLLGAMAFAGSKAWYSINHEGFGAKSDFLSYPAQYFYMNYGPWMSREMYALQGAFALAGGLLLALIFRRGRVLEAAERPQIHPDPRALLRACRWTFACALAAIVVEGGARELLRRQRAARVAPPLSEPEPRLGWVNRPRAAASLRIGGEDVSVQINSLGLRGPEYDHAKPPGIVRVLLLGGSAAEAYGVTESRSLRALLEARLNALGCGHFQVINAGVARYSTTQQALFFALEGARYRADVVLLLFNHEDMLDALEPDGVRSEEDRDSSGWTIPRDLRLAPSPALYEWHGSAALRLVSNATFVHATRLHRLLAPLGLVERPRPPRVLWPFGLREESQLARDLTAERLVALAADVRSRGARFAVVYAPAWFEVDDRAWEQLLAKYRMSPRFWARQRVARRLAEAARAAQVPLLDLRPSLVTAQQAGARLYFPEHGLWTVAGHALAAEVVAPWLKDSSCPAVEAPRKP